MSGYGMLRTQFERFALQECGASLLYWKLATQIARDDSLLEIASAGKSGPKPNLFLASVHYLLLGDNEHPLAAYYPTLGGTSSVDTGLSNTFRSFCIDHADDIRQLMETRLVQTNEVRRTAVLLPAMQLVNQRENDNKLALVEVGASAGLLLMLDRYGYDYGKHGQFGQPDSLVQITCEIRGNQAPPLSPDMPRIVERTGIDLNPVDVTNPDEACWLQALVWADQPERMARLRDAITIVADERPRLITGDALEALPPVLAGAGRDGVLCVFHCHTLNQFTPKGRERFAEILAETSMDRTVFEISLESYTDATRPALTVTVFIAGRRVQHEQLAYYDAHGAWLEWL